MTEHESEDKLRPEEQGGEVVQLLADPEVKAGLEATRLAIAERYAQIEQAGSRVKLLVEGVTDDGKCVAAANYDGQYIAFTYNLRDVASPGFADTLAERPIGKTDWHDIEIITPEDPPLVSWEEYREKRRELHKTDKVALKAVSQTYLSWRERNTLDFDVHGSEHAPRYGGKVVRSFEAAALGETGRTRAEQEVAPLRERQAEAEEQESWALRVGDEAAKAEHRAAQSEMAERARQTIAVMHANPELVRKNPDLVHDPVKAEHLARETKDSMDKAVAAKNESVRTKHEAEAEQQTEAAAREYDADPLGATKKTTKKGLFGRLKRN